MLLIAMTVSLQNVVFSSSAPIKIMPLGDSITACGNWRQLLLSNLTSNGYDVEFVGSQNYLTAHEGHSGLGPIGLSTSGNLNNWLSDAKPEIIIMHLGTNDSWGNNQASLIIPAFTILVGQMREYNPNMKILVAKIIPMYPADAGERCNENVLDLNSRIDDWAKGLSTDQSPIIVVDQYTGFDAIADTYDGVHPNDSGCVKMSDTWFAALKNVLSSSAVPTPTPVNTLKAGDVDGSGDVNSIDFANMRKYLLGMISEFPGGQAGFKAADVDGDECVTSIDFAYMRKYLLGMITEFPIK